MYGAEPILGVSGGTIRGARFVKLSGAADYTLLEADANEMAVGISDNAVRDAPLTGANSTDIAAAGDSFHYIPEGNICVLEIGSGGITRDAEIKSDGDGKGVAALTSGTTNQWVGAIALESAVEGELARVLVKVYPHIYAA